MRTGEEQERRKEEVVESFVKKKKRLQIELTASIRGRRFANRCRRELLSRNTMNDVDALNASLGT